MNREERNYAEKNKREAIEQAQKFVAFAAYNLGQARVTGGAVKDAFIQTAFDAISRAKAIMGVE